MSDTEWLQRINEKKAVTGASRPPLEWTDKPTGAPGAKRPAPAVKQNPAMVVATAIAVLVGLYFYYDYKHRVPARPLHASASKSSTTPSTMTVAERQAIDEKARAYSKKIDDEQYRKEIGADIAQLNSLAERFIDLNQVAAGTARIALPQVIQQMQALRREAAAITVHTCLRPGAASMASGIAEMINGYLSFMQSRGDSANTQATQHFEQGRAKLDQYVTQRNACIRR